MKDYQKQRVYDWEAVNIPEGQVVSFETAQTLVEYIWKEKGLLYPPKVKMAPKGVVSYLGKANRLHIILNDEYKITSKTIIHEIAHSLTGDVEGNTARHGPDFVGVYMWLLHHFHGQDIIRMMVTAKKAKVDFNINAIPYMKD